MRRLPVYFLLDTSGPMCGEPIHALNNALNGMINTLRSNAYALDSVWISIITYNSEVMENIPLTKLDELQLVEIECVNSLRNTGRALSFLLNTIETQLTEGQSHIDSDYKPLIFLLAVREPNDKELFTEMSSKLLTREYGIKIAFIIDNCSDVEWIKPFSDTIITHNKNYYIDFVRQFFNFSSELILTVLAKDYESLDSFNTNMLQIVKLPNRLTYMNL